MYLSPGGFQLADPTARGCGTDERKRSRSIPRLLIVHLFNGNGPRTI
jgi:hypothetical protein